MFTVTGFNDTQATSDLTLTQNGDQITLNIFLENMNRDEIAAFDAAVFGAGTYSKVSELTAGKVLSEFFSGSVHRNGINNKFSGISNGLDEFGNPLPRTLSDADLHEDNTEIHWFNGISAMIPSPSQDGSEDLGIGGVTGAGVNPHAVVTFNINGLTNENAVTLIGVGVVGMGDVVAGDGSNVTGEAVNGSIQIGPIPEPGTALLVGLGLSGLSLVGRRR